MIRRKIAGRDVNAIGLGCMGMSIAYGEPMNEADAVNLLHQALDLGVDHFDTAELYGFGANEALLGAAPLQASGTIDTSTSPPTLEVRLEGDNLLLQRSTNVLLRADAALAASGPLDALTITGDLGLRNGRMTQTIDLLGFLEGGRKPSTTGLQLFSIRDGPLASARLDVRVETRDPFLVRTNMARATMRIALRLTGTGEVPTPAGDIFLDETAVKLPGGLLRFPSGLIRFESSDPFTPQLDLRGEARLLGYDVVVKVSGAYDDPEIVLSSSPPLAVATTQQLFW